MELREIDRATANKIERLIRSGIRSLESVESYVEELRRDAQVDEETLRRKTAVFKALSDPTRVKVLELLDRRGELCVCEITAALGLTQPTTSHHLGILEKARLVRGRKEGKWNFYSISDRDLWTKIKELVA